MTVNKAVIAIAGKGTRMYPITKAIPKEMLPIGTTPILQMIIDEVILSGIKEILFVISPNRQLVAKYLVGVSNPEAFSKTNKLYDYLGNPAIKVGFEYQDMDLPVVGTAVAVSLAKSFTKDEPFALLYGDDIFIGAKPALISLIEASNKNNGATVIGVQHINRLEASNYATVICDDFDGVTGTCKQIIEKQPVSDIKSDLTSVGRYVLSSNIYNYLTNLEVHNGECWLTDAINNQANAEKVLVSLINSVRHDTGNPEGYIHAFKTLC